LVEIENILPVNRLQFWAGKPSIYNNNNNNNVEYKKKIKRIRSNSWRNNKFLFSFCLFFSKEMESGDPPKVCPFGEMLILC
jgi:hypothetical protein